MGFTMEAACWCHQGIIRGKNEDNFYFDGDYLNVHNHGMKSPLYMKKALHRNIYMAVFDGMGGENYGEIAAYYAALQMQQTQSLFLKFFPMVPYHLNKLIVKINDIVNCKKKELLTGQMGSTMVGFCFSPRHVHICNIGDSRAYCFRKGELIQLSKDHVINSFKREQKKAPLIQYLGIDSSEMQIEPYIARKELKCGDQYLLCSDGLTDMLTDIEIAHIMSNSENIKYCIENLLQEALDRGGYDNISIILCKITK